MRYLRGSLFDGPIVLGGNGISGSGRSQLPQAAHQRQGASRCDHRAEEPGGQRYDASR
jgi:hypothetical protein